MEGEDCKNCRGEKKPSEWPKPGDDGVGKGVNDLLFKQLHVLDIIDQTL